MNWAMIGALGEVFGAAAVVLTLFYLARQIREGAQQDRRHQAMELARIHDYGLESGRNAMKDIVATRGVQEWWAHRKHWFSPAFQAEIDRCIAEGAAKASFLERYDEREATTS